MSILLRSTGGVRLGCRRPVAPGASVRLAGSVLAGAAASIEVEDKDTNRGGHEGGGIREGDRRGGRGVEEARNHRRNDVAKALYRREDPERRAAHLVRRERGDGGVLRRLNAADSDTG